MTKLDTKINEHFPGLAVRKDLVKIVKGNAIGETECRVCKIFRTHASVPVTDRIRKILRTAYKLESVNYF